MPEGDSLHNLAARLRPVILDREIQTFTARRIADDVSRTLVGRRVVDVSARGKNLLIRFDDARVLHIHLKMDGRVFVEKPRSAFWAPRRPVSHPDLRMSLRSGVAIVGAHLPVCRLLTASQEKRAPDLQSLGPDLMDVRFAEDVAIQDDAIKRARALSDRSVAEALLVQRVACGIGNVYKSEILFLERVNPRVMLSKIDDDTVRRLLLCGSILLRRNLASPDARGRNGPRTTRPTLTGQRLWVYGRQGRPCFRCDIGTIEMFREITPVRDGVATHAPRSTYFCPECQPA